MVLLLVGGVLLSGRIRQEVFPEFQLDMVAITVAYPGASPSEVEQGVVLSIEEAVRGLDDIKGVSSMSNEGVGVVYAELELGANGELVQQEIQSAVNRITSFPRDAERPVVTLADNRNQNLSLMVYGDVSEAELRAVANDVRDALLLSPEITLVEISGIRPLEVSIEVSQETLRRYGLTLGQVAQAVSASSIELPAGGIRTESGEVLVRTTERRERGDEFEDIILISNRGGTQVRLGDIATVVDGFRETDETSFYNGVRAAEVRVFRVGDESPISVTDAVMEFMDEYRPNLPAGVEYATLNDSSEIYRDRINLLLRNAASGLILVMLTLGLFLDLKLALWVTMGIPVSFLGAMMLMPAMGVSLNMISLFAFILVLGIVVDDAIVVGEAIYYERERGAKGVSAAIKGVKSVAMPVVFSVLTTVVAFAPLLSVPGTSGKIMRVIPIIVILILMISLFESLFLLPSHLAHGDRPFQGGLLGLLAKGQQAFSRGFEVLVRRVYPWAVWPFIHLRYAMVGIGIAILILSFSIVISGKLKFEFLPKVEGDVIRASLTMPYGTPAAQTEAVVQRMLRIADELVQEHSGTATIGEGLYARVGAASSGGGPGGATTTSGSHRGEVVAFLVPIDQREITAAEFTQEWRERMSDVTGIDSLTFNFNTGPSSGSPVDIQLAHPDIVILEAASANLAADLAQLSGVIDIQDGFSEGKVQLDVNLRPEGRALGLTETDIALQLRNSYFGAESVRQQRGRDELRVFVRLPQAERATEYSLENMMVRTPAGGEVPLHEVASIVRGRSYTSIERDEGRRVVNVTADVDNTITTGNEVMLALREEGGPLERLLRTYPGLSWSVAGEQEEQADVMKNLQQGMLLALLAMYGLMAMAFRSYAQPVLIMVSIPFGLAGAIYGHLLMGYNLSLMSMFGLVALTGVVVNDSLVFIDALNEYRRSGLTATAAVYEAGIRRFRPILLTSLTTFFGLAPMLLETSVQARFLIPMAISLAFGVLVTTGIALLYIPSVYLILEDILGVLAWFGRLLTGAPNPAPGTEAPAQSEHDSGDSGEYAQAVPAAE
jgi:multidrug efflux pump subunit AcrB